MKVGVNMLKTFKTCLLLVEMFSLVMPRPRIVDYACYPKTLSAPQGGSADDALFLTPYIEKGKIDEAQKLATVPPMLKDVHSFSGYLTVDKTANSNLFFWLFKSQEGDWTKQPLVVWLQGGPGESSMLGLFTEIGPFFVTKTGELERRKYSWNRKYNLVFFDNPVGTGFSFTEKDSGYAENEIDVAKDLYEALVQLYKLFPALQKNKLFLTGESYAGKFVPAFGFKILQSNKVSTFKINLGGLMIGNAFTDPISQSEYGVYLYKLGLIDDHLRDVLVEYENQIRAEMRAGKFKLADDDTNRELGKIKTETGLRMFYDFVHDDIGSDNKYVDFINSTTTRKAIHVGNYAFNNGDKTKQHLQNDIMKSVKPWVEEMLAAEEFPIMFYSGQLDVIIPYALSVEFYKSLKWPHASEYHNARRCKFKVGTDVAGYFKTAGTFTELLVRNTGHMVPTSQPRWAYVMLERFITGSSNFKCPNGN